MTELNKKNVRKAIQQGKAVQARMPGGSWQDADPSQILLALADSTVAGHDQAEYRVKPDVPHARPTMSPSVSEHQSTVEPFKIASAMAQKT